MEIDWFWFNHSISIINIQHVPGTKMELWLISWLNKHVTWSNCSSSSALQSKNSNDELVVTVVWSMHRNWHQMFFPSNHHSVQFMSKFGFRFVLFDILHWANGPSFLSCSSSFFCCFHHRAMGIHIFIVDVLHFMCNWPLKNKHWRSCDIWSE